MPPEVRGGRSGRPSVLGREPDIWPTGGSIVSQFDKSFRQPENNEKLPASIGRGLLNWKTDPILLANSINTSEGVLKIFRADDDFRSEPEDNTSP